MEYIQCDGPFSESFQCHIFVLRNVFFNLVMMHLRPKKCLRHDANAFLTFARRRIITKIVFVKVTVLQACVLQEVKYHWE